MNGLTPAALASGAFFFAERRAGRSALVNRLPRRSAALVLSPRAWISFEGNPHETDGFAVEPMITVKVYPDRHHSGPCCQQILQGRHVLKPNGSATSSVSSSGILTVGSPMPMTLFSTWWDTTVRISSRA